MKRRTSTLPVRVYTYGCLPPTENRELVDKSIYLARLYRNKLIEIELARRHRYREITGAHGDLSGIMTEILESNARLEELRAHIKLARKDARSRVAQPQAAEQAKLLIVRLKELRKQASVVRAELKNDPVLQASVDASEEKAKEDVRQARAVCGVYWGTYLLAEAAVEAARKSRTDPKFGRWDGNGRIGVQIQGGATTADVMSGRCELLRIDALPDDQWNTRPGRRAAKTHVYIRVGSENRRAVWAKFPMILHRPLPADATIKGAMIVRKRVARDDQYELQIVFEAASVERTYMPKSAPVAAINLGWRTRPEGLRVAMIADELGHTQEVILPQNILDRLDHADSLRAIRDKHLDAFRPMITAAVNDLPNRPEWMTEDLKTMHLWKSAERYQRFVARWAEEYGLPKVQRYDRISREQVTNVPYEPVTLTREEVIKQRQRQGPLLGRFILERRHKDQLPGILPTSTHYQLLAPNSHPLAPLWNQTTGNLLSEISRMQRWDNVAERRDYLLDVNVVEISPEEELIVLADAWRRQDLHLLQWETYERNRALGHRREIYRILSSQLSKKYSMVVLDKFDLRKVAKLAAPEGENDLSAPIRKNRQRAATSSLRLEVMARNRTSLEVAMNNTHFCNECGSLQEFDAAVHVTHTCSECGVFWDQDVNAAKNLLLRYKQNVEAGGTSEEPEESEADGSDGGLDAGAFIDAEE